MSTTENNQRFDTYKYLELQLSKDELLDEAIGDEIPRAGNW